MSTFGGFNSMHNDSSTHDGVDEVMEMRKRIHDLESQLQRHQSADQNLKVMYHITNATNTSEGLQDLYQSIKEHLGKIIDTTNFFIALYNEEEDTVTLPFFTDEKEYFTSIPADKSFTSYVIKNNTPILIRDNEIDDLVQSGEVQIIGSRPKVWLGVPLTVNNKVIGAVVVQSYTNEEQYTEDDFEVLKFVSDHIAIAIKRKSAEESIRTSEAKYRKLLQSSSDGIFLHDLDGNIIDINPKAANLLGYSKSEILDMNIRDIHPEGVLSKSREAFAEVVKRGEVNLEIELVKKNGDTIKSELTSNIVEIGSKTVIQGIVRDITARKDYEEALEVSEDKFRSLAERSPNMIFINNGGKIEYVNEKCVEIMGYTREEFYHSDFNFLDLISEEHVSQVLENFHKQMRGIDVHPDEYSIKSKGGKPLAVYISSKLIPYGGSQAILGIITDISRLKLAEQSLRASEERYRKIFESTREGILIFSEKGVIISANPGAVTLLGYSDVDELEGLTAESVIAESEKRMGLFQDLLKTGNVQDIELVFKKKNDQHIHVLSTAAIHTDHAESTAALPSEHLESTVALSSEPSESASKYQVIFMDITERKRAEDEMKRRLMKFKLEEGNLYLIKESTPTLSIAALKDLTKVGYNSRVLSRSHREELQADIKEPFEYFWLAEKRTKFSLKPDVKSLRSSFDNITRRHVVLIDRLDYLIFKIGYEDVLSFIQHLRELIYLKGSIVLLSLDPFTMKKDELRLLEKECKEVEPLHKKIISDDLFNILKFIYRQNTLGLKPSYSSLGKELGISKPTVRKRVGDLISTGYIREDIRGRNKAVELTERGRQFFWK